jgi:hypothetical protein
MYFSRNTTASQRRRHASAIAIATTLRQSDHVNCITRVLCLTYGSERKLSHCGDSADRKFPIPIPDWKPRLVGGWIVGQNHILGLAYKVTRAARLFLSPNSALRTGMIYVGIYTHVHKYVYIYMRAYTCVHTYTCEHMYVLWRFVMWLRLFYQELQARWTRFALGKGMIQCYVILWWHMVHADMCLLVQLLVNGPVHFWFQISIKLVLIYTIDWHDNSKS